MGCPAHTDPFLAMTAAAEHIAAGKVAEVELEWWSDPDGQHEHRMTVTLRRNVKHIMTPIKPGTGERAGDVPLVTDVPDDLSDLDGPDDG